MHLLQVQKQEAWSEQYQVYKIVPKSSSTGSSTPEVCFIAYIKLVLEFQM